MTSLADEDLLSETRLTPSPKHKITYYETNIQSLGMVISIYNHPFINLTKHSTMSSLAFNRVLAISVVLLISFTTYAFLNF